jgi:hypothetical protein
MTKISKSRFVFCSKKLNIEPVRVNVAEQTESFNGQPQKRDATKPDYMILIFLIHE